MDFTRFIPTRVGYTKTHVIINSPEQVHPHSRGVYETILIDIDDSETVHPHSRGVYHMGNPEPAVVIGSSPLAWGIRNPDEHCGRISAVHPHSRGVYNIAVFTQQR